jgi:hypothetical protein
MFQPGAIPENLPTKQAQYTPRASRLFIRAKFSGGNLGAALSSVSLKISSCHPHVFPTLHEHENGMFVRT